MQGPVESVTSISLLNRLNTTPKDEAAWREFVRRYGEKVLGWCRYWRLQEADAADVTQAVLMKMVQNIQRFDRRRGSFRAWLKTIAHHAWYDLVNSRQHRVQKGSDSIARRLEAESASDDLARRLEAAWDEEVLLVASDRVRLRVQPQTWSAFDLTAMQQRSGREVAEELEMSLAAVYKARSNVTRMLQVEVARLESAEDA